MIVGHRHRYVYVAVPKTGTRSMKLWLRRDFEGEPVSQHGTKIPPGAETYFRFTTVRNPYTRAVSAWWSTTMQPDDRYRHRAVLEEIYGAHDLETYLRWTIDTRAGGRLQRRNEAKSALSQVDFLGGMELDLVIRVEDIPGRLEDLPFVGIDLLSRFPRINRSKGRPALPDLLTPNVVGLVNEWSPFDFEAFGYERREP